MLLALGPQLDNVLLATDGEGRACVKVCDFGYSKSQTECNTRCGTPEYMAPEVTPCPLPHLNFCASCAAVWVPVRASVVPAVAAVDRRRACCLAIPPMHVDIAKLDVIQETPSPHLVQGPPSVARADRGCPRCRCCS